MGVLLMTNSLEKPSVAWIQQLLTKYCLVLENDEKPLPLESFFKWEACNSLFDVLVQYGHCFDETINEKLGIVTILDEVISQTKDTLNRYIEMVKENSLKQMSDELDIDNTASKEMDQLVQLAQSKIKHDYKVREATERFKAILSLGHAEVLNGGNVDINYVTLGESNGKSMIHDLIPYLVLRINNSERLYILPVFIKSEVVLKDFVKYVLKSEYPNEDLGVTEKLVHNNN